jgi:acetyl esterase
LALDPQVRALLEAGRAAGVRPYHELGVEEARRVIDESALELFGRLEPLDAVEEVDAGGVRGRLFRPEGGDQGALVWFHGGGWVIGSLDSHDPLCRALAARSGCSVLAVDYRRAPEHPHPAALEDAWAATWWAAGAFGTIAVGGDSAGGQLAAVVAIRARDRAVRLRLQVLVVPVTDCAFETGSYREYATGYGLERATMEWFWNLYLPGLAGADDPEVSPLRATELSGLCPALVVTAECDPLRDEGDAYAARLRAAGVNVEHLRTEGMPHGFFRMPGVIERADEVVDLVARRAGDALR